MIEDAQVAQLRRKLATSRNRLLVIMMTLVCTGLVLIYSASCVKAGGNSGMDFAYLQKQVQWLLYGCVGMFIVSRLRPSHLRMLAWPLGLLVFALLVAVLIPGIGTTVNGASRWLRWGGNMQPSELAKFGMVIVMAAWLARFVSGQLPFWRGFLPGALLAGACCGLIMKEPDFGTAALISSVLVAMLIVAGARFWQVASLAIVAIPPAVVIGITKFDYILNRIHAWQSGTKDDKGYQIWMSKVALGSGGLTGMGLGEGVSKLYYLPEAHTDFILAVAGQELGFCGTIFILILFAAFVFEGARLVSNLPGRFSALCAFGIVCVIGLQAAFNIAVVTASVPPKGISLPFISYGGSGLCMAMMAVGVLVALTRNPELGEAVAAATAEEPQAARTDAKDKTQEQARKAA